MGEDIAAGAFVVDYEQSRALRKEWFTVENFWDQIAQVGIAYRGVTTMSVVIIVWREPDVVGRIC